MIRIDIYKTEEYFNIVTEKKSFFSNNIKTKIESIKLDDIENICRQEYKNSLNSINIFMKNGIEHVLINEECYNLEELYKFLFSNIKNYDYKIDKMDIDDLF